MPHPSLKFIQRFTDRNGHEWHYFRRRGFRRVRLSGLPFSSSVNMPNRVAAHHREGRVDQTRASAICLALGATTQAR